MFHMFSQAAAFKDKREERTGESRQHDCVFQVGLLYFRQFIYVSSFKYKNIEEHFLIVL